MTRRSRIVVGCFGLVTGFALILGVAPGQGPKGDKGEKSEKEKGKGKNKGEEEFVRKYADKFSKGETPSFEKFNDEAEKMFRRLDRNEDGALSAEELSEDLAVFAGQVDRNGDGKITLDEYRTFLQTQLKARVESQPPPEPKREKNSEPEKKKAEAPKDEPKPIVYHDPKNYPKELPAWFKEIDGDRDLQISLFEWRSAKRKVEEFLDMDLNGDGFLEIDEYFRFLKRK